MHRLNGSQEKRGRAVMLKLCTLPASPPSPSAGSVRVLRGPPRAKGPAPGPCLPHFPDGETKALRGLGSHSWIQVSEHPNGPRVCKEQRLTTRGGCTVRIGAPALGKALY